MKRQRETVGAILEIPIYGEYYAYAQIIPHGLCAFFDYRSREPLHDFSVLETVPVLFIIGVYTQVITQGVWLKVGKLPVRKEFEIAPMEYIYDMVGKKFEQYDPNTGEITPSTKEIARGREAAAVWDNNHIEDRIRDHYNNVPCIWLKKQYELFK